MIAPKLYFHITKRFLSTLTNMPAKIILTTNNYQGLPKQSDFVIKEEPITSLTDGEFLAKTEYISTERRPFLGKEQVNKVVPAEQIARIVESKNAKFKTGDLIVSDFGWRTQTVSNGTNSGFTVSPPRLLPNLGSLPQTLALGICGIQGCIAYYALLRVCEAKEGQVVVISAAGDCLGSTAVQIAKLKGCKVIGLTNSEEKRNWLINELGIEVILNYKADDFEKQYIAATPSGVDCYIDNLGGEISSLVMKRINKFGRVAVCGSLSTYNTESDDVKAAELQTIVKIAHLKMKGVSAVSALKSWSEATEQIVKWIEEGKLKYYENVIVGFENITQAHIEALQNENIGKTIIEVNSKSKI